MKDWSNINQGHINFFFGGEERDTGEEVNVYKNSIFYYSRVAPFAHLSIQLLYWYNKV